jgi:hypothetical protein
MTLQAQPTPLKLKITSEERNEKVSMLGKNRGKKKKRTGQSLFFCVKI